jgi:hypothetical protein
MFLACEWINAKAYSACDTEGRGCVVPFWVLVGIARLQTGGIDKDSARPRTAESGSTDIAFGHSSPCVQLDPEHQDTTLLSDVSTIKISGAPNSGCSDQPTVLFTHFNREEVPAQPYDASQNYSIAHFGQLAPSRGYYVSFFQATAGSDASKEDSKTGRPAPFRQSWIVKD